MRLTIYLIIVLFFLSGIQVQSQGVSLERSDYVNRLHGMWLGECIANWTGIQTEGDRTTPPFYTDSDWSSIGFVLNQNPWQADDDTDIEYVYLHLLNQHSLTTLTADQIRNGWMTHINSWIWVSNARVREMFNQGILPPATSLLAANELAIQIDAQLTTEIFGALAPGMPAKALEMSQLPILTTASSHAAHASQIHVLLYSLAALVDTQMTGRDQALWFVDEARKYIPESSKVIDIVDFVRADFISNSDVNNWESTRDKIYDRYQLHASSNGFRYAGWVESSVNFAVTIMALLYGEMDYRRTVQIGTLSGWDSDNPTATLGGFLGLVYGYEKLILEFPEISDFSDRYHVYRTRDALPDYLPEDSQAEDTFNLMAQRMLPVIDMAVTEAGGSVQDTLWNLPEPEETTFEDNPLYDIQRRSANNSVAAAGGAITIESSVNGSETESTVDGFEHDFSGSEWFGNFSQFKSDITDSISLTVSYDQSVDVHTVRLVEGYDLAGFTNIILEVNISGVWLNQSATIVQSVQADPNVPLQIIDFVLQSPVEATGIRVKGPVEGHLNVLELDALSEPSMFSGNLPPNVVITDPENGDSFTTPVDLTITVQAMDIDGDIDRVEFYHGLNKLGDDTEFPYRWTLKDLPAGYYTFTARAIDNKSAVSFSDPVWIFVSDSSIGGELIWHSYDVVTLVESNPVTAFDENGSTPALVEFYISTNDGGVDRGTPLNIFNTGRHPESFNKVENFWANSTGSDAYPHAGKSTVDRGFDSGEGNEPEPQGVRDLQLHPPESNKFVVAAFIAPFDGKYEISELAIRRVHNEGGEVNYFVFNSLKEMLIKLTATNNRQWIIDSNIYSLGELAAGDRIYFAVDRGENDNYYWDATEIAWTVKKLDPATDLNSGKVGNKLPKKFALEQNYPNPFNPSTIINYELPARSAGGPITNYVELVVYSLLGQNIATLVSENQQAGHHQVVWNASDLPSGIYYYILKSGQFQDVKKMVLLR